ncbi:MAG: hypothetical protein GYA46_07805 [candidate division Zixibacteria bacterium]|nr:hypothetical protein [candidate division Zixibacteria bacterium]
MDIKILLVLSALASCVMAQEADKQWVQEQSIPPVVRVALQQLKPDSAYVCSFHVNPFYLRGDFDGDSIADYAVLIKNTINGKIGLAVVSGQSNRVEVLGAGTLGKAGGDDFHWMDAWYVYPRGKVEHGATELPPPELKADALMVEKLESASGIIYWTGEKYEWYQQGD